MITKRKRRIVAAAAVGVGAILTLTACPSDSKTASKNLSREAEQFRIERKIVFYNGITDTYVAEVDGRCSVDPASGLSHALAVTCKIGPNRYIKDDLGLSDNVTWFMLQEKPVKVSAYHYKIIFKPQTVIPNLNVETGQ